MPKNSKEATQAHSTFLQTENFKKMQGVPFDRIRKFSKKSRRIVPKKTQRGRPFGLAFTFGSIKKIVA